MTEKQRSSGVQELIDRLREEGVEEGISQADQLVTDARRRATAMLDEARQQAAEILQHAREEADNLRTAAEDALLLAGRDAVLSLKEEIFKRFADHVRQLASHSLRDNQFMQRLILEIAGRAVPKDTKQPMELLLPEEVVGPGEIERQVKDAKEGSLSHFVLGLSSEMIREGVSFAAAEDDTPGLTVKMTGEDVEIVFNEKAITEFLLRHLLPRFRAMMNGLGR